MLHESGDVAAAIEPYALENARLLKEQNELHRKLIIKNDELETTMRDSKDQVRANLVQHIVSECVQLWELFNNGPFPCAPLKWLRSIWNKKAILVYPRY